MASTNDILGHNPEAQEAELKRKREGFDVKAHMAASANAPKWQDLSPDQQREFIANLRKQPASQSAQSRQSAQATGVPEFHLGLEDIRALAQAIGFQIVAIGDQPPADDGYAANREAKIQELTNDNDKLHARAVTAEATAADAIRELNTLKSATAPKEQPPNDESRTTGV